MNLYLILTILIIAILAFFLYRKKWEFKHIISLTLSLIFIFFFSYYGDKIISPIWHNANAADLWLIMFFLIYGGSAIIGALPFILHRKNKKEIKKVELIIKFWFAIGLIYIAIDNSTMGPFAVGPNSPYVHESLCKLPATYFSEDVWFGCMLERVGLNPYTELGVFLVYIVFTVVMLAAAGVIIGSKRLEKLMFVE